MPKKQPRTEEEILADFKRRNKKTAQRKRKLNDDKIRIIRDEYILGRSVQEIARRFSVSDQLIRDVLRGKIHADVVSYRLDGTTWFPKWDTTLRYEEPKTEDDIRYVPYKKPKGPFFKKKCWKNWPARSGGFSPQWEPTSV